jgi:hypothetical protein
MFFSVGWSKGAVQGTRHIAILVCLFNPFQVIGTFEPLYTLGAFDSYPDMVLLETWIPPKGSRNLQAPRSVLAELPVQHCSTRTLVAVHGLPVFQ